MWFTNSIEYSIDVENLPKDVKESELNMLQVGTSTIPITMMSYAILQLLNENLIYCQAKSFMFYNV